MTTAALLKIQKTQHYVADAMLAFQMQLAACFRGDAEEVLRQKRIAEYSTAEAIRAARDMLYPQENE